MLLFLAFILQKTFYGFLPKPFPLIFIALNVATFVYYYVDKSRAIKGSWRVPESTLHFISLIGGWGGAYIAQKSLRHKNKKAAFIRIYQLTVLINCTAIMVGATPHSLHFISGQLSQRLK